MKIRRLLQEELEKGRNDSSYPVKPERLVADIRAAMDESDMVLVDTAALRMNGVGLKPSQIFRLC